MDYKYQRRQIFGKRLKVPKHILNKVYNCTLFFNEFIEYQLDDKIPTSCIIESDRRILEKFGIDRCKELDWELINKRIYNNDINFRDILMSIDSQTDDINLALYELVKDQIKPSDYSPKMAKLYQDRLFEIDYEKYDYSESRTRVLKSNFNDGEVSLKEIISNWDLFKDKDLSYCLLNDENNTNHITDGDLKIFMSDYGNLAPLIIENNDIYVFINNLSNLSSDEEKSNYLKQFTDDILSNTKRQYGDYRPSIKLADEQYREIFKYSSLEDYLKMFNEQGATPIIEELKSLPQDYVFNMSIPFSELLKDDVLSFIGTYGLKNIIDFDNECGHFFTKNNCKMLKLMFDMYLHYAGNEHDPNKTILTKKVIDENGNYIERPYTKDEFYEAMRRMIIYGPSDMNYADKAPDYREMTGEFRVRNAELFISEQAPEELQKLFYTKSITPQLLLNHPEYIQYLKGKDLSSCFKNIEIQVEGSNALYGYENIYKFIGSKTDFNGVMSFITEYSDVLDIVFDRIMTDSYQYETRFTINDDIDKIGDRINATFIKLFLEKGLAYPKLIPQSMKDSYPLYFLPDNTPPEIKEKFYNRQFTIKDFSDNPELFDIFDKTNIACGFSESMSWIIPLFNNSENLKTANYNRLKVISAYSKIQDVALQNAFKEYVMEFGTNIDVEKIEYVSEVLSRLSLSNSSEIFTFRKELATQILKSNNPLESLSKIEDVFIRNNIPTVGKIYSCFEILHPDFQGFNFESSMVSPVLKKSSTRSKKIIVFSDLIKCSFGSNNRSVNAYLKNIEFGSSLYEGIKTGQIQFDSLGEIEKRELKIFSNHLATLYNNTMKAKMGNETFISSGDVLKDILEPSKKLSPDGTLDYNLADRVIRMFCGFAGIDTLEQAKEFIKQKVKIADSRNRHASNSDMILEQGDFIKGIGNIKYLRNILQNGSVSKEYLGSSAGSDATPLDTDISMIMSSDGTISEKMGATAASSYGPIWFVLKNDDRFMTTRTSSETLEAKRDMSKMEVFYTGVLGQGHYGIRTGFASSEINYIVMDNYDPRVGLEIAMNGFYIPVANKEGKILFTPKDYDELRAKMSGLSYFEEDNYSFSKNLITEETEYFAEQIEQSNYEVQAKREKINSIIKKSLEELGLHLKTNIDGDLTEGFVELIDTGSTGRGTNKPGDGDFDFMMRLDKKILSNPSRLNELKQTILRNLGRENSSELTGTGDFRLKNVQIDTDMSVDIDITFTKKTDKVSYSTDMALQDRLATISRTDPEKYKYVVANILLAKQVLKKAEAYKPNRGEIPQGGLGGVGIENWILQNGGSFIDAAKSFVDAAEGKSFSEFQSTYQIWDFGDNHLAERRGQYAHDNFVANNMSEEGYQKMVQALKEYLKTMEISQVQTEGIKR